MNRTITADTAPRLESADTIKTRVVEVLCQPPLGQAKTLALTAMIKFQGEERTERIYEILNCDPGINGALVSDIILATMISLDDHRERVAFYSRLAGMKNEGCLRIKGIQATAAMMVFDTLVPQTSIFWDYAAEFADLFMQAGNIKINDLAGFWKCDPKDIVSLISGKCETLIKVQRCEMITAVIREVFGRATKPDCAIRMFHTPPGEMLFERIVGELAHKRLSSYGIREKVRFLSWAPVD